MCYTKGGFIPPFILNILNMEIKHLDKRYILNLSILNSEVFSITLLTILAISAPLLIKSPQILVGSIVNFVLIFSVLRFGIKKTLPSVILPSLIAYSSNVLFGGATYFLLFFLPVIVLGNLVFVTLIKNLKLSIFSVLISGICKTLVLFLFAYIFVNHFHLPSLFLSSMGYIQLITSAIGGGVGFYLYKASI
jgi:hypothetical protein